MREQAPSSLAPSAARAARFAKTPSWLVLGLLAVLGGCGQKGPLTLPAGAKAAAPSASAPAAR